MTREPDALNGAAEIVLRGEPDAVPRARGFAASVLPHQPDQIMADVELVVAELVTNALLHGALPVTLRLAPLHDGVRIEVEDTGRAVPVKPQRSFDAMTGRGLELVSAVCNAWGVEPSPNGKVVWAVVGRNTEDRPTVDPFVDMEALLSAWDHEAKAERRYTVRLGAVPTDLLLAAKAHSDNVVRELMLVRAEEAVSGISLPAPMAALVTAVTQDFAEARADIKRQALDAARRDEPFVELVLQLPLSAADAGERYLSALAEADKHARAARMLTLAPPRSHQAFREWYVQGIVDQLRAAAQGEPPKRPQPFPQVMAAEVDRLSSLEDSWERLQLLQKITAELTGARSVQEIAKTVVDNASAHPGVETASVDVLTEHRMLRPIAWHGGHRRAGNASQEIPLDAEVPAAVVARTGQPLFLRRTTDIRQHPPPLAGSFPSARSLHVVPLSISGHTLGVLSLSFIGDEVADEAQLSYVRAMADVLAQAVQRVLASERAEAERGRDLRLLSAQLDVLAGIVAGQPLEAVLTSLLLAVEAVSPDGMVGCVMLLDDDGQRLRCSAAPSLPSGYLDGIDGLPVGPSSASAGTAAWTRQQVVVPDVMLDPRWAEHRHLALAAGLHACWSTPVLATGGRVLGTFDLYYPQAQQPTPADRALIAVLVRTLSMVIERSRADEERERELASERAAALTLQHSLLPAVPPAVGPLRLEARYRAGDPGVEVGGDWFDAIPVEGGAVLVVGDVQGHDLQAAALMGQLRTVARASAADGHSPERVLTALNRYLLHLETELLTTAVVVHLDAEEGRATAATAGHLPPLVVAPDGRGGWEAWDLDVDAGPPLGLDHAWEERSTQLPAGAILLLYTDGLVESRSWPLDHGLSLLRKTVEAQPPDADLSAFLDAALELLPTGSRGDDVAALGVLTPSGRAIEVTHFG